jgi:hypothetical protein
MSAHLDLFKVRGNMGKPRDKMNFSNVIALQSFLTSTNRKRKLDVKLNWIQ